MELFTEYKRVESPPMIVNVYRGRQTRKTTFRQSGLEIELTEKELYFMLGNAVHGVLFNSGLINLNVHSFIKLLTTWFYTQVNQMKNFYLQYLLSLNLYLNCFIKTIVEWIQNKFIRTIFLRETWKIVRLCKRTIFYLM